MATISDVYAGQLEMTAFKPTAAKDQGLEDILQNNAVETCLLMCIGIPGCTEISMEVTNSRCNSTEATGLLDGLPLIWMTYVKA